MSPLQRASLSKDPLKSLKDWVDSCSTTQEKSSALRDIKGALAQYRNRFFGAVVPESGPVRRWYSALCDAEVYARSEVIKSVGVKK